MVVYKENNVGPLRQDCHENHEHHLAILPILHVKGQAGERAASRLCQKTIDELLADINFDLSQSASFSQTTVQSSQQLNVGSMLGEDDSQSSFLASQEVTPTPSFTQTTERASKKRKNPRAAGQTLQENSKI